VGVTSQLDGIWGQQAGRNLTDCYDGILRHPRRLLPDRDKKFLRHRHVLESSGKKAVLLPLKSPSLIADIEWHMRSMKSECLERLVFFGDRSLRRPLAEFVKYYHEELNQQGLGAL